MQNHRGVTHPLAQIIFFFAMAFFPHFLISPFPFAIGFYTPTAVNE
jgi:hypothetical protein